MSVQTAQTMKKLTKIKLINWHYFQNETINVDGSFLLSGENASGKSTILDAIQLVLTTSTRSFNLATTAGEKRSKRDLKGYVRCKTGEEGNTYHRTGSVISYVALEFYEEGKDRFFTMGVKVDSPDVESDPIKKWFLVESDIDGITFIVNNKPAIDEQFSVSGRKVPLIRTTSEAKDRFKTRLGHLDDNFFDMIPKSLAFKPMDNVKNFINKFILPERKIDIDTLRENIRNLREMQTIIAEVKKQIEQLERILEKGDELEATDRDILVIDILIKLAALEDKKQKLDENNRNRQITESALAGKQQEVEESEGLLKSLENTLNEVRVSINTSDCTKLIEKLQNEIDMRKQQEANLTEKVELLNDQIHKAIEAVKAAELGSQSITAMGIRGLSGNLISDDEKRNIAVAIKSGIGTAKENEYRKKSSLETEDKVCRDKHEQLKHEIEELKKKRITYPENTVNLQAAIQKELDNRGYNTTVRVFADLLEISDSSWQDAVEGYLNTQRFNLFVEPAYYDIAAEVYDRLKNRIHSVALVNTGALDLNTQTPEGSLAEVITSENRYAKAYANEILGRVVRCKDVLELKGYNIAITKGCMLYQGKALRKINGEVYRIPYIGKYALQRQLEIKTEECAKLSDRIREIISERKISDEKIDKYDAFNGEIMLQNISAPAAMANVKAETQRLTSELNDAKKDPSIIELQIKAEELGEDVDRQKKLVDKLKAEVIHKERDLKEIVQTITEAETDIATLTGEIEEMSLNAPSALEGAKQKYAEHIKSKTPGTIFANYQPRRIALVNQRDKKHDDLTKLQMQYKDGELGTGESEQVMLSYREEHTELAKHDIIKCEEKLEKAKNDCEVEFRENFLIKMRENIGDADTIFKGLNKSLRDIRYGQDSYKFWLKPNQLKQGLYEMITSDINIGGFTLFSSMFEEKYHSEMEDLFSKLTESDTTGDAILNEYTDYRGYLDYDIEVISNGKSQFFSKIYGEKSGGETQTPYYVAIAASFAQMYSLGESIRIIMLDEAFDKMDDDRIGSMMQFFKEQNFQVILATPPAKMEVIGEYVDNIFMVYREGYNSFIEAYSL